MRGIIHYASKKKRYCLLADKSAVPQYPVVAWNFISGTGTREKIAEPYTFYLTGDTRIVGGQPVRECTRCGCPFRPRCVWNLMVMGNEYGPCFGRLYICAGANRSICHVDRPVVVSSSRGLMMAFATHWNSQYNEDSPFLARLSQWFHEGTKGPNVSTCLACFSWITRTHVKWVHPTQVFFVLDSSAGALKAKLFSLPSTLTRRGDFACLEHFSLKIK